MAPRTWSSVVEFYDDFAEHYHLVYGDGWHRAIRRQGEALDALIRSQLRSARSVLDCSCGVGTQAIGLAMRGYEVTGTDISERSLARAVETARDFNVALRTARADFRDLGALDDDFDVVMSCDNAIPHLLDDDDVDLVLQQMHDKLRPGGLLIASTRDYEAALAERERTFPPLDVPGPPRKLVVRVHEWDGPDDLRYTIRFLILTQTATGWEVTEHATRYRALPAARLTAAAERAGLENVEWLTAGQAHFHQPVLLARRPQARP
jgi:glycine/sarcosine N-methyltransferase